MADDLQELPSWDLTEIFPSAIDSKLGSAVEDAKERAEGIVQRYKGKLSGLSRDGIKSGLEEYEGFLAKLNDITLYASLAFSADMTVPEIQSLYDRTSKLEAKLGKDLAFFELELGRRVKEDPEIIYSEALANYRHFLERMRRRAAHQLSEVEEQLIIEKDQFGINAWQELQSKWLNTRMIEVEVEGQKKVLPYGEANGLFAHPDRGTRESAYRSIYATLGKDGEIFSAALRAICNDWVTVCERRGFSGPMDASLISNDTEMRVIESLLKTIGGNTGTYQRYLMLKAKTMGLPKLGCHDIIAPLPTSRAVRYDLKRAKEMILEAYSRFDADYSFAVRDMFQRRHLDLKPRFGKRNGAFCASWYSGRSAFILQSYNGTLNDVFTLAHELGHATHDYYWTRNQTILNGSIPMIVAETASIFGELLLADLMLSETADNAVKKAILCQMLDEAGMAAFQVTARVWFEESLYAAIKNGEFLDYKTICRYWVSARDRIYGDSVEWFPEMEAEWTMKPHYYIPNFRFYNYPYVYAQMFVYALYNKYKSEGIGFPPKLKRALEAGGSLSPNEIAHLMDLDVNDEKFWQLGIAQFEALIRGLQELQ
uniref:M3 family oligoendopeptidase n=1 Tax=Candidatus Methanomethylicus mesodigestus TaxID=1867258 RepID=A0A7C3J481_9CREN